MYKWFYFLSVQPNWSFYTIAAKEITRIAINNGVSTPIADIIKTNTK